jgi:methylglyoxal synthase
MLACPTIWSDIDSAIDATNIKAATIKRVIMDFLIKQMRAVPTATRGHVKAQMRIAHVLSVPRPLNTAADEGK